MKKLLLLLSICFLLFSCSESQQDDSKLIELKNEQNSNTQRIMFNLLSKEEKLRYWTDKIELLLGSNSLRDNQRNLLNELKNSLNTTIFDTEIEENDEREIFINVYCKDFIDRARVEFSDDYLNENFFTFRIIKSITSDEIVGGAREDCTCKKGAYFTCGIGTGVFCGTADCQVLSDGCGFLGLHECDGKCKL